MKRPGYTIVEMIVMVGIMAVVMLVAITAYLTSTRIIRNELNSSVVVIGSGRILGPLDELLRQGINVEAQYPPTGAATVSTGTSALVFSIPSLDASGNPQTANKDYVTVVLDSTIVGNARLLMTIYPNTTLPSTRPGGETTIATYVDSIYWRYPTVLATDANTVTTTLRLSRTAQLQTSNQTIILNSTLRNH